MTILETICKFFSLCMQPHISKSQNNLANCRKRSKYKRTKINIFFIKKTDKQPSQKIIRKTHLNNNKLDSKKHKIKLKARNVQQSKQQQNSQKHQDMEHIGQSITKNFFHFTEQSRIQCKKDIKENQQRPEKHVQIASQLEVKSGWVWKTFNKIKTSIAHKQINVQKEKSEEQKSVN